VPSLVFVAVLVVAAIGGVSPRPAAASCIQTTALQQFFNADVVFDGVALDDANATGIERFRVLRYLKSSGPAVVRVRTGRTPHSSTSGAIAPVPGETWRIYGKRRAGGVVGTSVCDGSRRLGAPARPSLTVVGRFGARTLVDAAGSTSRSQTMFVRRGDRLRFLFSFEPTRVILQYGRSRVRLLPAGHAVTWRVPSSGSYPVRITATGTRRDASERVPFTSRFAFRLVARRA